MASVGIENHIPVVGFPNSPTSASLDGDVMRKTSVWNVGLCLEPYFLALCKSLHGIGFKQSNNTACDLLGRSLLQVCLFQFQRIRHSPLQWARKRNPSCMMVSCSSMQEIFRLFSDRKSMESKSVKNSREKSIWPDSNVIRLFHTDLEISAGSAEFSTELSPHTQGEFG